MDIQHPFPDPDFSLAEALPEAIAALSFPFFYHILQFPFGQCTMAFHLQDAPKSPIPFLYPRHHASYLSTQQKTFKRANGMQSFEGLCGLRVFLSSI